MPSHRVSAEISVSENTAVIGGFAVTVRRLWLRIGFDRSTGLPMIRRCLIDTGAPVTVIPYSIYHTQGFVWHQVNDPAIAPGSTSWNGVPADLGFIQVWVSTAHGPPCGPLDILAKFPRQPTPAEFRGKDRPPVLVGLDFLASATSTLELDWQQQPARGGIEFP